MKGYWYKVHSAGTLIQHCKWHIMLRWSNTLWYPNIFWCGDILCIPVATVCPFFSIYQQFTADCNK